MGQHWPSSRPHVIVVGGGIAGLSAAYDLATSHDVTLLEAEGAGGGKLRTGELAGRPLDLGPDAFITRDRAAIELCDELGIEASLVPPSATGVALFARGRMRKLPEQLVLGVPSDLGSLRRSHVLSRSAVLRSAVDLVLPGRAAPMHLGEPGGPDPTIAETIGRRLGREVLDVLVDPLLGGINAGDVRSLSLASAAPALAADLAGRRSVMRALRRRASPATGGGPIFLGVAGGMGALVRRLTDACRERGVEIVTGATVERLERAGGGGRWWVAARSGDLDADAVVLAVPAFRAAPLLERLTPMLASELAAIPYASVVTTTLAYDEEAVPASTTRALEAAVGPATTRLPGNGVLVERGRGLVTAFTFTSTKWPASAAPGQVVIKASAGRHGDDRAIALSDEALHTAVRGELSTVLGISAAPIASVVQRWPASFPQYVNGHAARLARLEELAARLPGLALAGAAYHGIGIPACVRSGRRAAARLASVSDAPASA